MSKADKIKLNRLANIHNKKVNIAADIFDKNVKTLGKAKAKKIFDISKYIATKELHISMAKLGWKPGNETVR